MKTSLKIIFSAGCAAVLLAAPLRAQDNGGGGGGPDASPPPSDTAPNPPPAGARGGPAGGPGMRPGAPGGAPGDARGGPGGGPDGRSRRGGGDGGGSGRDGVWGRGGPSADIVEKMQKVEELDGKLWPLAQRVRDAVAKDKPAAKVELRKAMEELFDARLALDEAVQKAHETRAAEMKTSLARHKSQREAIIDKKLTEMVGEDPDDWDY